MAQHKPAPVSKEQLDQATAFWQGFTKLSTYSIIAVFFIWS